MIEILNDWETIKRSNTVWHGKITWHSDFILYKVLLQHSHGHFFMFVHGCSHATKAVEWLQQSLYVVLSSLLSAEVHSWRAEHCLVHCYCTDTVITSQHLKYRVYHCTVTFCFIISALCIMPKQRKTKAWQSRCVFLVETIVPALFFWTSMQVQRKFPYFIIHLCSWGAST